MSLARYQNLTEKIRAWANGPVVYEVYDVHRSQFKLYKWPTGDINNLDQIDQSRGFRAVYQGEPDSELLAQHLRANFIVRGSRRFSRPAGRACTLATLDR